ncbi:hypothetical protein HZA73_08150 [candidate division TA06 bacterium]|nr:hypothetical protein [candidate division TA06 bacterium]
MNSKEIQPWVPFSFYDFFGYLFPGILFATSALILFKWSFINSSVIDTIWNVCENKSFVIGLVLITMSLVLIYIVGHIIAIISSIFYGSILISSILGYPYKHVLNIKETDGKQYSRSTHLCSIFFFNLWLISPILFSASVFKIITYAFLLVITILFFIRFIVTVFDEINKREEFVKFTNKKIIKSIINFSLYYPIYYLAYVLRIGISMIRKLIAIDVPFPKEFIDNYETYFEEKFNIDYRKAGSENYWLTNFQVSNKCPENSLSIRTWLHIYGFLRNISSASYFVCFLLAVLFYFIGNNDVVKIDIFKWQLGLTYVIAIVLGLGYWKIFHTYYTKGIIRSFYVSVSEEKTKKI